MLPNIFDSLVYMRTKEGGVVSYNWLWVGIPIIYIYVIYIFKLLLLHAAQLQVENYSVTVSHPAFGSHYFAYITGTMSLLQKKTSPCSLLQSPTNKKAKSPLSAKPIELHLHDGGTYDESVKKLVIIGPFDDTKDLFGKLRLIWPCGPEPKKWPWNTIRFLALPLQRRPPKIAHMWSVCLWHARKNTWYGSARRCRDSS